MSMQLQRPRLLSGSLADAEADVVDDAEMREERSFLHHQTDVAAMRGDAGSGVAMGWPSSVISPLSGTSKPAIRRSSVVLPEPEGRPRRCASRHDVEIEIGKRLRRAVALGEAADGKDAHRPPSPGGGE